MLNSVSLRCWTLAYLTVLLFSGVACGQSTATSNANATSNAKLTVGFSDTIKLGHWSPVALTVPANTAGIDTAHRLEISAIDGDESPVIYTHEARAAQAANGELLCFQGLCRLGRRYGLLTATLRDDSGNVLASSSVDLENTAFQLAASTDYLTVILSANDSFSSAVKQSLGIGVEAASKDSDRHAVQIASFVDLPSDELGWQSVNQVILSLPSARSIADLSDQQWTALRQWIGGGGRLVLITDPTMPKLITDTPLREFLPLVKDAPGTMSSSRELERLVGNSRIRLINRGQAGIDFTAFKNSLPTASAVSVADADGAPLVLHLAEGFGQVTVITINLESERLTQWPSYSGLLENVLLGDSNQGRNGLAEQRNEANRAGTAVTHYGYDDMSGQLRVPLDDFSTVRFLDFTLIAILIGAYILLISVGDYFFLNRFVKRMEMTWITFPLLAFLFCGIAWGIAYFTRPNRLQINQMEIIDITPDQDYSRGTSWINVYSPAGQKIDIAMEPKTSLGLNITQSAVTWQGLPGDGLGGMETTTTTGFKRTGYRQSADDASKTNQTVQQLPLQVSSTRSLISNYKLESPSSISSQLEVRRDRLQGTFKNPLDVPIYNGKIFFGSYVYLLKKPLQPDDIVFIETGADEKTIRTHLNRRSAKSTQGNDVGKTQSQPWDPRDKSLTRIADMMMFFQAAGGKTYTGLSHRYFPQIDATRLLEMNQAVLVGQLESGSQLKIDDQETNNLYDSSVTMVRIVLPVESQ